MDRGPVISYDAQNQLGQGTTTFVDMFSYETYGAIKGKRLRVIKTNPMTLGRTQTATGDLNMSYAHDNEGKVTVITYPTDAQANVTPQYNYQYDAMSRPSGMSDQNNGTVVSGVLYGAANELLSMNYDGGTETRSYNSMFQLTGISGLGQNISYNFPAGANNGKIASQYDAVSGEMVSYQYDSLNRLISASAAGWSQSYSYDGFGNLTNRVGSGAAVGNNPTAADPATNRLVNAAYDANGNMLSTGNVYDVENRLMQATMAGGTIQYAYDSRNKRIWQGQFTNSNDSQMLMSDTVSMFGAGGQLAATYTPQPGFNNTTNPVGITFTQVVQRVYFGKKLIKWLDAAYAPHNAVPDRLASVGKYYPYGEERNSPALPNDEVKFATYTRDSATGNDYADQRYYNSSSGRFMTPDPYKAGAGSKDTGNWNRYDYVAGDPANRLDQQGLDWNDAALWATFNALPGLFAPPIATEYVYDLAPGPDGGGGGQELFELVQGDSTKTLDQGGPISPCGSLPPARTLGVNVSLGLFSGLSGSGEILINYRSGQVSLFVAGDIFVGWNGLLSTATYTGLVFNVGTDNSNYSGPFTVATLGVGKFMGALAASSGGYANPFSLDFQKAGSAVIGKRPTNPGVSRVKPPSGRE